MLHASNETYSQKKTHWKQNNKNNKSKIGEKKAASKAVPDSWMQY